MMDMIELVDVQLDHPVHGRAPLVSEANLRVGPGEVVVVVGAAGVGTSRLVAAVLGEVIVDAGRIEVLGRDVGKLRRASLRLLRRKVGIVPQDLCLLDDRSVLVNVALPLEIDGVPRALSTVRAMDVIGRLELEAEAGTNVDRLSQSQRQRVAVARALIRRPELLVADHPTSMQDAGGAEIVCAAIELASKAGTACLVLGRDPALREIAERNDWRRAVLAGGVLRDIADIVTYGMSIDELLVVGESLPVPAPPADNILPFPASVGAL